MAIIAHIAHYSSGSNSKNPTLVLWTWRGIKTSWCPVSLVWQKQTGWTSLPPFTTQCSSSLGSVGHFFQLHLFKSLHLKSWTFHTIGECRVTMNGPCICERTRKCPLCGRSGGSHVNFFPHAPLINFDRNALFFRYLCTSLVRLCSTCTEIDCLRRLSNEQMKLYNSPFLYTHFL